MAIPKKNLLEAFQASAAAEKAVGPPAGRASASSKAGGPFASTPSAPAVYDAPRRERWRPDQLQRLVALFVVVSVAAFFLGRASVGRVDASDATPPDVGAAGAASAPAQATIAPQPAPVESASQPLTPAERALFDPKNRYTVKLVEYRKGRDNELAIQTLRYLQSRDLPAVAQFQGTRLYILLGAAESQRELDALLATAKTMTGPPPLHKKAEFHDAYVVAIDRLIER